MKKIDIHIHPILEKDPTLDDYVRIMDHHDVVAALVHATPGGLWKDYPVANDDAVLAACERHPGRLYGSCHIDLGEAPERNIKKIEFYASHGFKCVKMFPNLGFDPNDEIHEPVWEAVEAHGLACFSHCGYLAHSSDAPQTRISSLTASPFHFEVPARRHPAINFVFGHFGGAATYLETIVLCERLDNCFADSCRGWGEWVWRHRMPGLEDFPMEKFLYGTDNLGERYSEDEKWWTELLASMGRTPEELELFFCRNAARILGLEV
ncbi:MAG: amidohydrolase family protein [Anaerolineae bacterium]|nr:amidohydrolase family protein [Anaerolineae bacterium]